MNARTEITIAPTDEAVAQLRESWLWLLGENWRPLLFSAIGDVFLQLPAGSVWWLSTATGGLEQVAESEPEFVELLGSSEKLHEWFLPGLVQALKAADKPLSPGQCYSYKTLPVFSDGSFSVDNMHALDAREHFGFTGEVMRQIQALPDGAQVTIKVGR